LFRASLGGLAVRYTRIGLASYAIASVLVVVVVGVAWARSRALPEPASAVSVDASSPALGVARESAAEAYDAECGGCHGAGEARGRSIPALRGLAAELFLSEGGRDYLIDFMLAGRVRSVEEGRIVYTESHPSYTELPDARVAAIINHILVSWGNDELLPPEPRLYTAGDIAAARARP
jgi:cytochrome c5